MLYILFFLKEGYDLRMWLKDAKFEHLDTKLNIMDLQLLYLDMLSGSPSQLFY